MNTWFSNGILGVLTGVILLYKLDKVVSILLDDIRLTVMAEILF